MVFGHMSRGAQIQKMYKMINLKRIVEQQGMEGQYYDLGVDFSSFKRMLDGSTDQIKQKFEKNIGAKLSGKRIRARASRGYKQYVKDYEFDVSRITLDDYYDNYVVVAHDNTTPKAKEYFLKPGFKIQILGAASGQPTQGDERPAVEKKPEPQQKPVVPNPDAAQSQPMAPAGTSVEEPSVKENVGTGHFDAYSIDTISQDIKSWLPSILRKPNTAIRDFIKGLGWLKNLGNGRSIAMFDLKLPQAAIKVALTAANLKKLLGSADKNGTISTRYEVTNVEPDVKNDEVIVRVKKTMIDQRA